MSERSFREDISKLDYLGSKEYVAEIIFSVSASGKNEMFNVDVFCTGRKHDYPGRYKLQWTRNGKPELPGLKPEAEQRVRKIFRNTACLTSGFGHSERSADTSGIKDIDTLILVIKELKSFGIIIKI